MNKEDLDDLIENDQAFMVYNPNNLHGEVVRHRLQNIEFFKINIKKNSNRYSRFPIRKK